jgi:hypothetical protein
MSYVIWSEEHGAWWGPGRHGYTRSLKAAGRYGEAEAREIVRQANQYIFCRQGAGQFNELAIVDPLLEVEVVE